MDREIAIIMEEVFDKNWEVSETKVEDNKSKFISNISSRRGMNKFWRRAGRDLYKELLLSKKPALKMNKRIRYKEGLKRAVRHYDVVWRSWLERSVPKSGNLFEWMTDYEREYYEKYAQADGVVAQRMKESCLRAAWSRFRSFCRFKKTRRGDFLKDLQYRFDMIERQKKARIKAHFEEFKEIFDDASVEVSLNAFHV